MDNVKALRVKIRTERELRAAARRVADRELMLELDQVISGLEVSQSRSM